MGNVKSDAGSNEDKKGETRFNKLRKVGPAAGSMVDCRSADGCSSRSHAGIISGDRTRGVAETSGDCRQNAPMATPTPKRIAPTATCVVATSAALLLQIVHAPNKVCAATAKSQATDSFRRSELS